ncbi:MAG: hydrogenase maturation protease [Candidatus Omnitrophota bacterium]
MKYLAFDLGKVLFDFDFNIALTKIEDKISCRREEIIKAFFQEDFCLDFEKGLQSPYRFYEKFKEAFGANLSYDQFVDVWCDIFTPKEEMVNLISRLKTVYPVYLISNINQLHADYLKDKFPDIFNLFDRLILSCEVKSVKPEREIYQQLTKDNCALEDIIYIDDREDLIKEAAKLNLKAVRFVDYGQVIVALEKEGVFIPYAHEAATFSLLAEKINSCKRPLLVGLGNRLRCDDMVGSCIAEELEGELKLEVYDVKEALENYLDKIKRYGGDLVVFLDMAKYKSLNSFELFSFDSLDKETFCLTHNASLKLAIQYLRKEHGLDILILGIRGYNNSIGEIMSKEVMRAKSMIENFFIRNYSEKR